MFPRPRRYTNRKITTTWSNTPLYIKLGISEAEMNTDLALQARVHDYEERDKEEETSERKPGAGLPTDTGIKAEEEKSVVDEGEKQSAGDLDDGTKTTSETGDVTVVSSNSGEDKTIATRNETPEDKAAATAAEESTEHVHGKQNQGGHTPGEAWTETPHFLWGP